MMKSKSLKQWYNDDPKLGCIGWYDQTGFIGRKPMKSKSLKPPTGQKLADAMARMLL